MGFALCQIYNIYITQSQNQPGQKGPLRSLSPADELTPPCQPDHGTHPDFP